VITSNRINVPEVAEQVLADGCADMVSMARPFLADPEFVKKAKEGRRDEINVCIGCNQACLDHIFNRKLTSCLVNPRACHETELIYVPTKKRRKFAVVGAGAAGIAAACVLAERGHEVDLFEAADKIGGQLNMAATIPGKEEFHEMLKYFATRIKMSGVNLRLNTKASVELLANKGYEEVFLASGVVPRAPKIPGQDRANVLSYVDVLAHKKAVGEKVAVVGAGGIGFDVSEFLVKGAHSPTLDLQAWLAEWGVTSPANAPGGLAKPHIPDISRKVTLLQRKFSKIGAGLGKTTGWIHRAELKTRGVEMLSGVNYERIDDNGLHITFGEKRENATTIEADTIVLCTGQDPLRELQAPLEAAGLKVTLIGGADVAAELDAKRAIDQGSRVAAAVA
jgi:2,4-dienoyl-CoA reductase (NADPH2)